MSITPLQPISAWTDQAGYKLDSGAPQAGGKTESRRMGDTSDQRLASSAAMTTVEGALALDGFARGVRGGDAGAARTAGTGRLAGLCR
jgi:hypothetical protein